MKNKMELVYIYAFKIISSKLQFNVNSNQIFNKYFILQNKKNPNCFQIEGHRPFFSYLKFQLV